MKSFKLIQFTFLLLCSSLFFNSCSKDKESDQEINELIETGLVGEWNVVEGIANVYDNGYLLADIHMVTGGKIKFENEGKGLSDFSIQIGEDKHDLSGPFIWTEEAFEIVITYPNSEVERWVKVDDERNNKTIQYTVFDEDDSSSETEITLMLERK